MQSDLWVPLKLSEEHKTYITITCTYRFNVVILKHVLINGSEKWVYDNSKHNQLPQNISVSDLHY